MLSILAARGLPVEGEVRVRIEACRDADVLRRWVTRAVSVGAAAELFLPEPEAPAASPEAPPAG